MHHKRAVKRSGMWSVPTQMFTAVAHLCETFSRFCSFFHCNKYNQMCLTDKLVHHLFGDYNICFLLYVKHQHLVYAINLIATPSIDSTSVYLGGKQDRNVC